MNPKAPTSGNSNSPKGRDGKGWFGHLRIMSREDIPPQRRPQRQSVVGSLDFWADVEELCERTRQEQALPYEVVGIDLTKYGPQLKSLKRPVVSVLTKLREMLRSYRVEPYIEIIQRGKVITLARVEDAHPRHHKSGG